MAARRHTHKYHRTLLTFGKVWACALPDCNHYMPPHMEALVNGKYTRCWGTDCENTFQLSPSNMKDERPLCDTCKGLQVNAAMSEVLGINNL